MAQKITSANVDSGLVQTYKPIANGKYKQHNVVLSETITLFH